MAKERTSDPAPYQRTPREQEIADRWLARKKAGPLLPRFVKGGDGRVKPDHPDEGLAQILIMDALGLRSVSEYILLMQQSVNLTAVDREPDVHDLNALFSLMAGLEPQNSLEAMLAMQMGAVHLAMVKQAVRLAGADMLAQYEAYNTAFNKLARTFTTQLETLKKMRSGGPQRVIVEHKHYHLHQSPSEGGGVGVETETEHQSHVRSIPEREAVLGYLETDGAAVQGAGDDR